MSLYGFTDDFDSSLAAIPGSPVESSFPLSTEATSIDSLEKEVLTIANLDYHHPNCEKNQSITDRPLPVANHHQPTIRERTMLSNGSACLEGERKTSGARRNQANKGKIRVVYLSSSALHEVPRSYTCSYIPASHSNHSPLTRQNGPSVILPQIRVEGETYDSDEF